MSYFKQGLKMTESERRAADAIETAFARMAAVSTDLDRRIDEDIELLLRAGVELHRISLVSTEMSLDREQRRELHVDGGPVQMYVIRFEAEAAAEGGGEVESKA